MKKFKGFRWYVQVSYRIPGTMRFKEDILELFTIKSDKEMFNYEVQEIFRMQHPNYDEWRIVEKVYDGAVYA